MFYLGVAKLVLIMINIKRPKQFLSSLPAVNKLTLRDGSRIQDAISVSFMKNKNFITVPLTFYVRVYVCVCRKNVYKIVIGCLCLKSP